MAYGVETMEDKALGALCSVPPEDRRNEARAEVNRRARERGEPEPFIIDNADRD